MRKRAVLTAMAATLLFVAACSSNTKNTAGSAASSSSSGAASSSTAGCDAKGKTVGYSEPLPDPNFKLIEKVIQDDLTKVGATLKSTNANLDPGKQISDLQTMLQQKIDVLLTNPVDPKAVQQVLDQYRSAKIPIVVQETKFGGPYATNVTAYVEEAIDAGAKLLKAKVGDGKVGAIIGPPFAEILTRQAEAFKAAAQKYGLNVVDTQTNQMITPDGAAQIASGWKQQFGADMKGIWTFNDTSAVGVASTLDSVFSPAIVSINGQPEAIPLVKDGKILATYDLQQDKLAHALAYAAIQALCGKPLPSDIYVHLKVIDQSTVGAWKPPDEVAKTPFTVELKDEGGKQFVVTP